MARKCAVCHDFSIGYTVNWGKLRFLGYIYEDHEQRQWFGIRYAIWQCTKCGRVQARYPRELDQKHLDYLETQILDGI